MAGGFTPAPRKKTALDNNKLTLSAPSPVSGGSTAKLAWGLHNNNPRITVYTGDPSEKDNDKANYGRIQAHVDLPVLYAFFDVLENMTKSTTELNTKIKLENKNFTFFGGKRSDYPVVQSELWCGKDKEGIVWMSITAKDRPTVKFSFIPSDFHNYYLGDGSAMSKAEVSCYYARGFISVLRSLYANLAVTEYVDLQALKNEKQGGQGGGFNRGGQGGFNRGGNPGGGFNRSQTPSNKLDDSDSDIPF